MSTFLLLSASMGDGHDTVAAALAERLRADGHQAVRADVLELLPGRLLGAGLRGSYQTCMRYAPWVYGGVHAAFLRPSRGPGSAPMAAAAGPGLLALVEQASCDAVVSVFHLAAQTAGRLRSSGRLRVPSAVVVTDFALHQQWLHPGNDLHLCLTPQIADEVAAATGRPAVATGAILGTRVLAARKAPQQAGSAAQAGVPVERPRVLVSAGAWGVGSRFADTARALTAAGFAPAVLCGRNERLRRRLSLLPGVEALGWQEDLPAVLASSSALVDNAAGQTALEALALGLPVVGFRPIPGHGRQGVLAMAELGLTRVAATPHELVRELADLIHGPARPVDPALFDGDPAAELARLVGAPGRGA
ncbi:MGDG synthase family glycosyltransferase [Streptacidiphilus monticola]|uniref:Galactosyldiacylglycerol synthase n=1 Tax=Streptacidiphilus monticola TaxID=2161674 RepID=A0ABW1G6P4_9ACTN